MRKIIFSVIAALVLTSPLFAQDAGGGSAAPASIKPHGTELVLKLEVAPSAKLHLDQDTGLTTPGTGPGLGGPYPNPGFDNRTQSANNVGIYAAGEVYYYILGFLGLGGGIKHQFDRTIDNFGEISITNFYVSIKPKLTLPADWGIDYAYGLLQCGYGMFNNVYNVSDPATGPIATSTSGGMYYAAGIGCEFSNFIFEVLFCSNDSKITASDSSAPFSSLKATYTSTNINVGYRFTL